MKVCDLPDCGKKVYAKGLCSPHYQKKWRLGDPLGTSKKDTRPVTYIKEVAAKYQGDDCLIWPFYRNTDSYGRVFYRGKLDGAHRVTCEEAHGPPPTDKHLALHSCNNGHLACVNQKHLRWGTYRDNREDQLKAQMERRANA